MSEEISFYDSISLDDDENDSINIHGLTFIDTSNTYENSLIHWSDSLDVSSYLRDMTDMTSFEEITNTEKDEKSSSLIESWSSIVDDIDNSLYLSNRLSPQEDAFSVDENCSIPATPTKDIDDQWIYPAPAQEAKEHSCRLSPESSSNEAFLLKIQAQAPPNRILFSASTCYSTPVKPISIFPSPSLSPFVSNLISTSTYGIAFSQHSQSMKQSLTFSPLTQSFSNPLYMDSPPDLTSLSPFALFDQFFHDSSQIDIDRNVNDSLTPLSIEFFPSISWLKCYGVTMYHRSQDFRYSSLEYVLYLPSSLFSTLFEEDFSLQRLSDVTQCHITIQDLIHKDSIQQYIIFSSYLTESSNDSLLQSCHHALQEISSYLLSRLQPHPSSEIALIEPTLDYSHVLESTELLLAGTPSKFAAESPG